MIEIIDAQLFWICTENFAISNHSALSYSLIATTFMFNLQIQDIDSRIM